LDNSNDSKEIISKQQEDHYKILDTQIERIISLFDAKSKHFQIAFYGSIAFTLLFFFISILPYVYLVNFNYDTDQKLDAISEDVARF
jgi:hypothetical protein